MGGTPGPEIEKVLPPFENEVQGYLLSREYNPAGVVVHELHHERVCILSSIRGAPYCKGCSLRNTTDSSVSHFRV